MIAKISLIALLAVVANASSCGFSSGLSSLSSSSLSSGFGSRSVSVPVSVSTASVSRSVPVVAARSASSFGVSSSVGSASSVRSVTRNLVGQGKYPVALKNCGPTPDKQIPVHTTHITAPVQEKPTISLKTRIPAPKTVCHTCTCYKTVVRPRVQQQIITVPSVQRFIQTTHRPVVEQIHYEAAPVNCDDSVSASQLQFVEVGSGASSGVSSASIDVSSLPAPQVQDIQPHQLPEFVVDTPQQTGCVSEIQTVQVPQVQTVNVPAPQVQTVQVQVPEVQTVQVPQVQTVQVQAPQVQTVQVPAPQIQIPTPRFEAVQVQAPQVQTVQVPVQQVQTVQLQAPQVQTVQVPTQQIQTVQASVPQFETVQVNRPVVSQGSDILNFQTSGINSFAQGLSY